VSRGLSEAGCCVLGAADAWRMNALTGSPLTSEVSKGDGSGLVKQQGYILLVPQGSGDVTQGQVHGCDVTQPLCGRLCQSTAGGGHGHGAVMTQCSGCLVEGAVLCCAAAAVHSHSRHGVNALVCASTSCVYIMLPADVELDVLDMHELQPLHRQING
jgi:hypothetical protein